MWIPWGLHGGDQHGPRGEGSTHQVGVSAPVPSGSWTSSPGPGGEPPAARRALLPSVHEGLRNTSHTHIGPLKHRSMSSVLREPVLSAADASFMTYYTIVF